jgi:hypothetical protein
VKKDVNFFAVNLLSQQNIVMMDEQSKIIGHVLKKASKLDYIVIGGKSVLLHIPFHILYVLQQVLPDYFVETEWTILVKKTQESEEDDDEKKTPARGTDGDYIKLSNMLTSALGINVTITETDTPKKTIIKNHDTVLATLILDDGSFSKSMCIEPDRKHNGIKYASFCDTVSGLKHALEEHNSLKTILQLRVLLNGYNNNLVEEPSSALLKSLLDELNLNVSIKSDEISIKTTCKPEPKTGSSKEIPPRRYPLSEPFQIPRYSRQESLYPLSESVYPRQESVYSRQESLYPRQESVYSRQESLYPRQESLYSRQESVYPRQESLYSHQESVYPRQESVYSRQESLYPRQESLYSRQESVYPRQESLYSHQESVYPRQELLYQRPELVYQRPELVYQRPELQYKQEPFPYQRPEPQYKQDQRLQVPQSTYLPINQGLPILPIQPIFQTKESTYQPFQPIQPILPILPSQELTYQPIQSIQPIPPILPSQESTYQPIQPVQPILPSQESTYQPIQPIQPILPILPSQESTYQPIQPVQPILPSQESTYQPIQPVQPILPSQESIYKTSLEGKKTRRNTRKRRTRKNKF